MDDATAATFSAPLLTPRRPQNSQKSCSLRRLQPFGSSSRTHPRHRRRCLRHLPFFKDLKLAREEHHRGNWEIAPTYTYESPEYVTVLSGVNSNLNGEEWRN